MSVSTYIIYLYLRILFICIYVCILNHTMQVAMCAYLFVRTLVNALVLQGKTSSAQVAAGDNDHDCKWSIFASWWKDRSEMQQSNAGSTRARFALIWCPCASCIWLVHPAPILPPTSKNTPLAVIVVITCCNLRWWCFSLEH